ncbi:hypothetical protein HaLaN_32888 [Haematococcus lacustris]|uniref:Uncharacterized protein n=1 Tax=Haematococcus lacustris TaxID=44745 RepID=A0A6A0AKZ8_HAELA|nr:hypothetical protein HaLaN_32888 [Haematococcus lacustris]
MMREPLTRSCCCCRRS